MNSKLIWLSLLLSLTSACSHVLRVQSNPEGVDIYAISPKSEEQKLIGKTPLETNLNKLSQFVHVLPSSREYITIVAETKDYDSKQLMIPIGIMGSSDTTVRVKLEPSKPKTDNSKLVVQYLLNAQDLVNKGDFDRADLEVERAIQLEGLNPWSYTMRGHILIMKKDYKKALAAYEKSMEIDPTNQMLLRKIVDVRKFLKEKVNAEK